MATYIIGDVHGCYDQLQKLLHKIQFDESSDQLIFVGDLVGKGPKSLDVVTFVVNYDCVQYVLGNHDLFAMALAYQCYPHIQHPYQTMFQHNEALLNAWRLKSQLFIKSDELKYAVIHAGLFPQWDLAQAKQLCDLVVKDLHSNAFKDLLSNIEGDEPCCWSEELTSWPLKRFVINACTRMRFVNDQGCLDFREKDKVVSEFDSLKSWFDCKLALEDYRLFFGHWAVLNGKHTPPKIFATDTGCVYGGQLTCYQLESLNPPLKISV